MTETRGYQENRDIWSDYNARQEFEHDLINRKTTWSLTGQTILFAAYGLTLSRDFVKDGDHFRTVVAGSGLALAVITFVGVMALFRSKCLSWTDYAKFYSDAKKKHRPYYLPQPLDEEDLQWGVRTGNSKITFLPDILIPVIFAVAWGFLI